MAYHEFDKTDEVARFLADIDFTIVGRSKGTFSPNHMAYHCNLSKGDAAFGTTYQSNPAVHGEPSVTDVIAALASDATVAADYDIDDFADELGFTKPSEAIRAYEDCQKSSEWLRNGLGLSSSDIADLSQTLDESADEVKKAMESIVSERKAERERKYPKAPEGFVTIESLQEDLDLGDYGDQCVDYGEDYIIDRFCDVADENVDLYYHDLFKWLPDNYEWIEEAAVQGLLEGANGDLIKITQMAQHICFSQNMYDHQEDIVKYVTLESLKDVGVYAVSQELADALDTEVDYADADTFDEALDGAKKQIESIMAANLEGTLGDEDLAQEAADQLVGDDDYGIVNPAALSAEAVHVVNEKGYNAALAECEFWKDYKLEQDTSEAEWSSLDTMNKQCCESRSALAQDDLGHETEQNR